MNKTPNEIIDALISIKDWHKGDLMLSEIETINDACNCIQRLVEEKKNFTEKIPLISVGNFDLKHTIKNCL